MTSPVARLHVGPLSPAQAAGVTALAEAARQADGVAPLSEHALLHAQHLSAGSAREPAARDFLLVSGEAPAGYAHLDSAGAQDDLSGELVVHPAHRRRGHATALISALAASAGGRGVRLWAHGDLPAAAGLARATGFTRARSLWQMRKALARTEGDPGIAEPSFPAGVAVRTFVPGKDEDAWLALNALAFAHHPEQGAWTRGDLELREAQPWFDPAGFFLAERDGELVGFHWTKVHAEGPDGVPEGEVYVVGIAPGRQGGGLGRALTIAGLRYLEARGLAHVMLYVDEENTAATRMYTALGFTRWNTDVMYRRA